MRLRWSSPSLRPSRGSATSWPLSWGGAGRGSLACALTLSALAPGCVALAAPASARRIARASDAGGPLTYHGGPVMHSSAIHSIYWAPAGHPFPAGYTALTDAFFRGAAADGGQNANVFASLTQYTDSQGPAADGASYASGIVDDAPYPASGCAIPGTSVCLTDAQIQSEIDSLVSAGSLPRGLGDLYVLFTPDGVGECGYEDACTHQGLCSYHSWIGTRASPTLYAFIPYASVAGCQGPSSPNGNPADYAINLASHEYSESITDPLANAWTDESGNEVADKCLSWFGAPLGSTRFGIYDAVIGGGFYELQGDWSNAHGRCVGGLAQFGFAPALVRSAEPVRFDASSSAGPRGRITAFTWHFGDGSSASGPVAVHRFPDAGVYQVLLSVGAGASVVSARVTVTVLPGLPQVRILSRALSSTLSQGLLVRVVGEGAGRLTITLLRPGRRSLQLAAVELPLDPERSRTVRIHLGKRQRAQLARVRHPRIVAMLSEAVAGRRAGSAHSTAALR